MTLNISAKKARRIYASEVEEDIRDASLLLKNSNSEEFQRRRKHPKRHNFSENGTFWQQEQPKQVTYKVLALDFISF